MDKLNLITTFLHVARIGSFAGTASYLGVDPSTISKSIQQLESHLGVKLFNRTTRSLKLTPAGANYQLTCMEILDNLKACEQQLQQQQDEPRGLLRINLPVAYGQCYVMPMMGRFRQQYPDIELDISLTDDYVDMVNESVDVAIRSGKLQDSRLVAKKLTPMDFAICASKEYLDRSKPVTRENIQQHQWVSYRFIHTGMLMPVFDIEEKAGKKSYSKYDPKPVLTTTDGLSLITASEQGAGLVQAPHFLLRDSIESGRLQIVQSYYRSPDFSVYVYMLNKRFIPARVRAFLDFIIQELALMNESLDSTFISNQGFTLLPSSKT